ncbi:MULTISPECIES: hypothetical protein [Salimicrobium]|uniref:Uncharacterized protein n=3 Tax=Salimicrobium TaxID=351195 RepID=K2GA31_9BACI|nr:MULTISPECIES: hypothetical protein [Salimicrobium]EKE31182.1 hypothetical protein MJ3_09438 [Salimicrobium jeotgali]MBM7697256.1 hypothetical protein [Salimicrobium jeotgali]SDX57363.1 hypothetical protein SAMN04488081_0711 [Salimicrobium album]SIS95151.1 hypothetical protein SAMN05421758_11237 [Salimicrobium salexigens]
MNLLRSVIDLAVVAAVGVLFVGYSLFVYPVEVLNEKTSSKARENELKYAPEL